MNGRGKSIIGVTRVLDLIERRWVVELWTRPKLEGGCSLEPEAVMMIEVKMSRAVSRLR